MNAPIWSPRPERVAAANITRFQARVRERYPESESSSLYQWSIAKPAHFWREVWDFCEIRASRPADTIVDHPERMPGARWFEGARLNFAENLLRFSDDRPALVFWNERGKQRELSYRQVGEQVACIGAALRRLGIRPHDRIAGFMPNMPQTVIAMLASASVGAVWSSCSPDFGTKGVLDRFGQIQPTILFSADAYPYGGKVHDCLDKTKNIATSIPSIERTVVVPYLGTGRELPAGAQWWDDFAKLGTGAADGDRDGASRYEQLPFDHPLYVMYSSGTTGLPKCMVHGAGGTLIQHLKELALHTDLDRSDTIFYYTTCGWMMWNWLISSLAVGATVVLYDGSPFEPRPSFLFEMAERERITVFGTSAKYLSAVEKEGLRPAEAHDLSSLRTVLSTGSPLAPESYDYVRREIGSDVCLASISGGTDLISCFALGDPRLPVHRGELQTRGLGMKVEIWDEEGQPRIGVPGELVCTAAFPSMPTGFWNDPMGAKYRSAYFEHFPGVWRHGDWAELTERGGMIIHGRSDATLNPGGVRIGTAEIYRQVEQFDEVVESLVIGQEWDGDTRIVLFTRLRPGIFLDEELATSIRRRLRDTASPHHVPKVIVQVDDIPRTLSGKISEMAVHAVVHGRPVRNAEALANPQSLKLFESLEVLAT